MFDWVLSTPLFYDVALPYLLLIVNMSSTMFSCVLLLNMNMTSTLIQCFGVYLLLILNMISTLIQWTP